jgi:hypothetical protein
MVLLQRMLILKVLLFVWNHEKEDYIYEANLTFFLAFKREKIERRGDRI